MLPHNIIVHVAIIIEFAEIPLWFGLKQVIHVQIKTQAPCPCLTLYEYVTLSIFQGQMSKLSVT